MAGAHPLWRSTPYKAEKWGRALYDQDALAMLTWMCPPGLATLLEWPGQLGGMNVPAAVLTPRGPARDPQPPPPLIIHGYGRSGKTALRRMTTQPPFPKLLDAVAGRSGRPLGLGPTPFAFNTWMEICASPALRFHLRIPRGWEGRPESRLTLLGLGGKTTLTDPGNHPLAAALLDEAVCFVTTPHTYGPTVAQMDRKGGQV